MARKVKTISISNLSIGYASKGNTKVVAENITADVLQGELTCVIGANGIGKSTLLRTLSAFQPQLAGEILIQQKEIEQYSKKELATLISVVLTEKPDIKDMTVSELVGLGRSPYTDFWGTLDKEDKESVDNAITVVNIESLSQRLTHTLSDGEYQKVMITKALAQETPIMLLDEPTAFLDFPSKVEIMQLLHRLSRQTNKTIFLSTHDLELALQLADKIWLMDKQSGIRAGVPEDLSLDGSLSRFFARKGIIFDPDTGLFRIENTFNKQIKLTKGDGNEQRYAMVSKALLRNGIMASPYATSQCRIEVKEKEIIIHRTGQETVSVHSIEELLDEIKD